MRSQKCLSNQTADEDGQSSKTQRRPSSRDQAPVASLEDEICILPRENLGMLWAHRGTDVDLGSH